jgi:hypothetical protein
MKKTTITLAIGVICSIIGANNLDAMTWNFYYGHWLEWFPYSWAFLPNVLTPVWPSYFFGGILPFAIGIFIFGWYIGHELAHIEAQTPKMVKQ